MSPGAWTGLVIIALSLAGMIVTAVLARRERLKRQFEREYQIMVAHHGSLADDEDARNR